MMRYQGLSPDNLPLSNGRRSHWRSCKEDDGIIGITEIDGDAAAKTNKEIPKFRSPSSTTQDNNFSPDTGNSPNQNGDGGGDVLLQWGHRKRSRFSRLAAGGGGMTMATDESSSSSSTQIQAMINVQRRSISLPTPAATPAGAVEIKNIATNTIANMPPPPSSMLPTIISITAAAAKAAMTSTSNGKLGNIKSFSKDTPAFVNRRTMEEQGSGGGSGPHPPRNGGGRTAGAAAADGGAASSSRSITKAGKRSPLKLMEKQHDHRKSFTNSGTDDKLNGIIQEQEVAMNHHNIGCGQPQEAGCSTAATTNYFDDNNNIAAKSVAGDDKAANNGGGGVKEWPRVYIPLTRKEKEEDFFVMKGTKLPQRPKKRPKAVDRMLQYCYPGMWLSEVTKARYEVKEKKGTTKKQKRRGLKGMESIDSGSE